MLSERQLLALPNNVVQYFRELEADIIRRICTSIGEISAVSITDIYKLQNLQSIGYDITEIEKAIADKVGKSADDVHKIFKQAAEIEYSTQTAAYKNLTDRKFIPFSDNTQLHQLISSISHVTAGEFKNISNTSTIGITTRSGKVSPIGVSYREAVDYAALQVRLGQQDFYGAIRETVMSMSNNGTQVLYASGNVRRLDSAARMNILGAQQSLSNQQADLVGQQYGADGWEITWHSGHRPSHWFGGKQFSKAEFDRQGIQDLMDEPNCYHRKFPIIMGISQPAYTDEQLRQFDAQQQVEREYNGVAYDKYAATQRQRQYETAIRRKKDEANAYNALADGYINGGGSESDALYKQYKDTATLARAKANSINQEYARFSNEMGLFTQPKRASVPGAANITVANNSIKTLTIPENRGIILSGGGNMIDDRKTGGLRRSPFNTLSETEIEHLKNEIRAINADESVFVFNDYITTAYHDVTDKISVRANVFSDKHSIHPRDLMSERAVLAHEYYGHRAYRNTDMAKGSWSDEFRASYMAAKNTPNLTDEDRRYLILDAVERAKEAGITIKYNDFMRRILYGI